MSKSLDDYRLLRDRAQELYEKAQAKFGPDDRRERMERLEKAYQGMYGGMERERESWWNQDGDPIRVLRSDEKMGGPEGSEYSMARLFRGITTGNWRGAEIEKAALAENPPTASGSIQVPTPLADFFVDKVRNQLALTQAGVRTVPMESSTLKIIQVTGDPTPGWKAELAASTESQGTYSTVSLNSHTLVASTFLSQELFEDSPMANDVLTSQLAKVVALEVDRAGLFGTGSSNQPLGLVNTSGVSVDSTTFGTNGSAISGTTPASHVAWDWLSSAAFARRQANEEPSAYIIHARTAGELDLLRASTGEPLRQPFGLDNIKQVVSNQVPINLTQGTSSTASQCIIGDFQQLLMGMRHEVVFETTREAAGNATNAWTQLAVGVRCFIRVDFAVARTSAFGVVNGIL